MNLEETGLLSSVEGLVRSTEDNFQNLVGLFVILLAILIVLGIWNLLTGNRSVSKGITNLFLKVTIKNPLVDQRTFLSPSESHFREVGARSATLITSDKLEKGQRIEIDLSSLPDYPEKDIFLPAMVSGVVPVRGCDSFFTKIRFIPSHGPVIKSLLKYVRQHSPANGN